MAKSQRCPLAVPFTDIVGCTALVETGESRGTEAWGEPDVLMRGFLADTEPMAKP